MDKKLIKYILYLIGVIIVGFIIINTDWKKVYIHIRSISLKSIILLLLFQYITILLLTLQWKSMALNVKEGVSFLDILMVNVKGNIVDAITPGVKAGGELARIYELRKRLNIDLGNATIIVGLQKTISILSFLFLTLLSLIWFNFTMAMDRQYLYIFLIVIALFSIFLGLLLLFSLRPYGLIKVLYKILGKSRFIEKIENTIKEYSNIIKKLWSEKKRLLNQMLLAIFIWSFYAFKLMLLVREFHVSMDYMSIAAITFLSYVIGMLPLLPGSIGSFESAMVALLSIRGVSMEMGISIAFIFRFVTFWFEFIISCFILLLDILFARKGEKNVGIKIQ
ncbi:MAG: flippase-like domain-containing protein [Tissierellia bacterium]|nr:flippase-like domain-containing protein [Tissierellia bacterium]